MSNQAILSVPDTIKETSFPFNLTKLGVITISWLCLMKFSSNDIDIFIKNVFIFGLGYLYELLGIMATTCNKTTKTIFAIQFTYLFLVLLFFINILLFKDNNLMIDLTFTKIKLPITIKYYYLSSFIWPCCSYWLFFIERRK